MPDERLTIEQKKALHYPVKSCPDGIAIKDVDMRKRIVTGLFNSALYFDSQYDVVMPGAMNKSITDRGPHSQATCKIKHTLFHDLTKLPGRIQTLEEKTIKYTPPGTMGQSVTGPYFETWMTDTQLGNDTLINYQEKVYDNHSIGFIYKNIERVHESDENWNKYLSMLINPEDAIETGFMDLCWELKLYEGATVGIGSNELTPFLGTKNGTNEIQIMKLNDRLDLLTKQVHSGTQSDEMMETFQIQIEQIKQLIYELLNRKPDVKDTRLGVPSEPTTDELKQYLSRVLTI